MTPFHPLWRALVAHSAPCRLLGNPVCAHPGVSGDLDQVGQEGKWQGRAWGNALSQHRFHTKEGGTEA